jgi:K+-sensing histidine kinase KdpD
MPPTDPRWPKVLSLSVHEFRTPMTVVAGYIRMLLKDRAGALTDPQRRLLEEAEKACGRLSGLLAEMSELSNLEAGTAPFNKSAVDLRAILRDAVAELPPLPDREVAVTVETGSGPASMTADPIRLKNALAAVTASLRRELIGDEPLVIRERSTPNGHEILFGDPATIAALEAESGDTHATFDEWRGGVGLSLMVARRVLAAHGAEIFGAPGDYKAGARILFRSA